MKVFAEGEPVDEDDGGGAEGNSEADAKEGEA